MISSKNVNRVGALQTWYNATKAMALEHARDQLRFDTIYPQSGNMLLPNKHAGVPDGGVLAEMLEAKCVAIPIGRLLEPSDVVGVALVLDEPANSSISGIGVHFDGARYV